MFYLRHSRSPACVCALFFFLFPSCLRSLCAEARCFPHSDLQPQIAAFSSSNTWTPHWLSNKEQTPRLFTLPINRLLLWAWLVELQEKVNKITVWWLFSYVMIVKRFGISADDHFCVTIFISTEKNNIFWHVSLLFLSQTPHHHHI